mmetsp:Transcript_14424/g.35211  ORF Transcript_14424/g.35211 Transcript_14424/m.35211 type:complete len:251 (+) Transcript_14424:1076-1828(+)
MGATCAMGSPIGSCSQWPSMPPTTTRDKGPYPMAVCSRSVHPLGRPWHVYSSRAAPISRQTATASAAVSAAAACPGPASVPVPVPIPVAVLSTCHTAIIASPANLTMSAPCPVSMSIMLPRYSFSASLIRSAPASPVEVDPTRFAPCSPPAPPAPLLHISARAVYPETSAKITTASTTLSVGVMTVDSAACDSAMSGTNRAERTSLLNSRASSLLFFSLSALLKTLVRDFRNCGDPDVVDSVKSHGTCPG